MDELSESDLLDLTVWEDMAALADLYPAAAVVILRLRSLFAAVK